jgi:hypothetical protein
MNLAKILSVILLVSLVACDVNDTNRIEENRKVYVTKMVNKTITVATKKDSDIVVGKIVDRQSDIGSPVVVCSEKMNTCARTNSKGNYYITPAISFPGTAILGARSYSDVDTMNTPENFVPVIQNDTTYDTASVLDTNVISVNGVDSIIVTDSTIITQNISIVDTAAVEDTLSIISNGTILREVPIDSWGFILPTNYVVQRDISAEDATNDSLIRSIEAVYFITGDSVAKVIPLGRSNKFFSGFLYTFYDDSSFRKDIKIYNLFIRAKDSLGRIICITPIETFSERFGDFDKKVLSVKTGLPEAKIVPKMIPAAKNNKNMKDAIREYLAEADTTINWVGIEMIPVNGRIQHPEGGDIIIFDGWDLLTLIEQYSSVSVDIFSKTDSIMTVVMYYDAPPGEYITPNEWVTKKYDIADAGKIVFPVDKFYDTEYRNIRFYLK